jgi:Raf kinase inhibitor-like YbhB/YbcL family protein
MAIFAETARSAGRLVRHAIGAALSPVRAGEEKIATKDSKLAAAHTIRIQSDAFGAGQPIPKKYAAEEGGENVSPPLKWSGLPQGTVSLALIVEDPDAPMPKPSIHWLIWDLSPGLPGLPGGVAKVPMPADPVGAVQGRNDAKEVGYYGPLPPRGHGVHHYHFQLFALDRKLGLGPDATREDLVKAMNGHVLAQGERVGTYERQ